MSIFNASIYQKTSGRRCLRLLGSVVLPLAVLLFSATSQAATTITYYHNDALGSPVAATDASGTVIWREQYRPFGETLRNETAADNNSRSFSGHVKDKETGLLYMGARFYDPQLGRFMAIDPQGFKIGNPQTFNRYAYANNNPYKYVDPDGEAALLLLYANTRGVSLDQAVRMNAPGTQALGVGLTVYAGGATLIYGGGSGVLAARSAIRFGGGLFRRGIRNGIDDLLRAGQQLDRNGLTKAGRALQKHGDRQGSVFPKSTGSAAARNQQGQDILEGILKSGRQTSKPNRFGGKDIFDNNTGRGVRFKGDGSMDAFLEP